MAEDSVFYQDTRYDKNLIFRIIWISLVALTFGYLYVIYRPYIFIPKQVTNLNDAAHLGFKPSGSIGHALGVAGYIFMLFSYLFYVLRKKIESFESLGPLSMWLEIHIFLGTLGSVLIMFHCAFGLMGIVSVTFWIMLLVLISGVFGKVLFSYCFWGISAIYESLHAIDLFIEKDLRNASEISPVIKRIMDLKSPGFPSTVGFIETFQQWRFIKKETGYLLDLVNEEYENDQQEELCKWANELIKRLREIRSTAILNLCLSILNKWKLIHKVFSYLLFFITLAHILVTSYWGYRWIF